MNCKPGDLAIVVRARVPANLGRIIRVIVFNPNARFVNRPGVFGGWEYEGEELIPSEPGYRCRAVRDECLRPLRNQDGADETLQWAGKPEGVTA